MMVLPVELSVMASRGAPAALTVVVSGSLSPGLTGARLRRLAAVEWAALAAVDTREAIVLLVLVEVGGERRDVLVLQWRRECFGPLY